VCGELQNAVGILMPDTQTLGQIWGMIPDCDAIKACGEVNGVQISNGPPEYRISSLQSTRGLLKRKLEEFLLRDSQGMAEKKG
jgi:hypothetical protein